MPAIEQHPLRAGRGVELLWECTVERQRARAMSTIEQTTLSDDN
jgi:hypothetical protein